MSSLLISYCDTSFNYYPITDLSGYLNNYFTGQFLLRQLTPASASTDVLVGARPDLFNSEVEAIIYTSIEPEYTKDVHTLNIPAFKFDTSISGQLSITGMVQHTLTIQHNSFNTVNLLYTGQPVLKMNKEIVSVKILTKMENSVNMGSTFFIKNQ